MTFISRYKWISTAVLVLLVLGIGSIVYVTFFNSGDVHFEKKADTLLIRNSHYEMAFRIKDGGIDYLKDLQSEHNLSVGNRSGALWWGFMADDTSANSINAKSFSYDWNGGKGELTFHYGGELQVDITTTFSSDNRIQMQAKLINGTAGILQSFRFPYELKFAAKDVKDGILPMLPGAKLSAAFFKDNNAYEGQYPGVMFASYVALRTTSGNVSMYDLSADPVVTTDLGFKNQTNDAGKTAIVHNYKTWISPKEEWQSPVTVLEVGGDYKDSILSYRKLNGIDGNRSITDKLGADKAQYAQLPLLKLDIAALSTETWKTLKSKFVDTLPYSGILHLVGFQQGGHDENYPDFIPPDTKWGGTKEFESFIQYAKEKGNRIVPYTNFSWWGIHSPTLGKLPNGVKLEDIVVKQQNASILKEDYGDHSGYVVNMNHPFVLERIAAEHKKLLDAGVDGIFEDQWGIRNAPYSGNEVRPAHTNPWSAYFAGVKSYFAQSAKQKMYTEDGTDVLANDSVGFMGTNYLWDILGYRKNTAAYTAYYPLASMLFRDKVMLYQHDLAAETMTDNKDLLRWNLAMGYNLSGDLYNGTSNPWIDLIGVFQKYVLSNYFDALVVNYEQPNTTTSVTDFGSYIVTANWDKEKPYRLNEATTLASGGFDVASKDQTVRAGNYSRYNSLDLDPGEHNLVEVRGDKDIKIFQPVGTDTTLRVLKGKSWSHALAAAYTADGSKIADLPIKEEGDWLQFDYIAKIQNKKTAYIGLTASDKLSTISDVPFKKVKLQINIALKASIRSTTNANKDLRPELALDGDPYTYWESLSNQFPQSVTLDLGKEQQVQRIQLKLPPPDAWATRQQEIEISGSSDGKTFTLLKNMQSYTFDPATDNTVEISLPSSQFQYLKLEIKSNTGWPAAQLSEIEVYGE